jgi:hypothetical protein
MSKQRPAQPLITQFSSNRVITDNKFTSLGCRNLCD